MKKFLSFALALLVFVFPVVALAESSDGETKEYDCLAEQTAARYEAAKRAKEPQYLYTTLIILGNKQRPGMATSAGWFVIGSHQDACASALSMATTAYPAHQGWVVTLAVAFLLPDSALKGGLKH